MFVPVFFVSIGMNITFDGIGNQIWFILALTVIAVLTKLIGCGLGARMTGFDAKSSAIIGAGMVSRGEVALIIAGTGLSSGSISTRLLYSYRYCRYFNYNDYTTNVEIHFWCKR